VIQNFWGFFADEMRSSWKTGEFFHVGILGLLAAMIVLNFCAWPESKGQRPGNKILTALQTVAIPRLHERGTTIKGQQGRNTELIH
jgi:hypothetical protein